MRKKSAAAKEAVAKKRRKLVRLERDLQSNDSRNLANESIDELPITTTASLSAQNCTSSLAVALLADHKQAPKCLAAQMDSSSLLSKETSSSARINTTATSGNIYPLRSSSIPLLDKDFFCRSRGNLLLRPPTSCIPSSIQPLLQKKCAIPQAITESGSMSSIAITILANCKREPVMPLAHTDSPSFVPNVISNSLSSNVSSNNSLLPTMSISLPDNDIPCSENLTLPPPSTSTLLLAPNFDETGRQFTSSIKAQKERLSIKAQKERHKYATDPLYRQTKCAATKKKYREDLRYKDIKLAQSSSKYANNSEHRLQVQTFSIEKYADDDSHRHCVLKRQIEKYANDHIYREKVQKRSVEKYANDEVHRKKVQASSVEKYAKDSAHNNMVKASAKASYLKMCEKRTDICHAITEFELATKDLPIYVCCVCHRLLFRNQGRECAHDKYTDGTISAHCITDDYLHVCGNNCVDDCPIVSGPRGKLFICHTCHSHLNSGKMPPQAVANNMKLTPMGNVFSSLNSLEMQLVALCVPFQKIVALCRGKQKAIKGPVICVPSDIHKTTNVLPRPIGDSRIVGVKLKRKLVYKGYTEYQDVDSVKVDRALHMLKQQNRWYANITLNPNWARETDELSSLVNDENSQPLIDENVKGDRDVTRDVIEIEGVLHDSCLQPLDLTSELVAELDNIAISLAPAEGNIPINIFLEKDIEAKAFPALFPTGANTYDSDRDVNLTRCKYYNARVLGADSRFASNPQYIFFAQYANELAQLMSGISISLRKGSKNKHFTPAMLLDKDSLQQILKSDDGFRFFHSIRGSPKFWQDTMNNLFAMLRNLGIPTFFVTLSSADISRWTSHLSAILKQSGDYRDDNDILNMDWNEKCKVLRSNPVTAVRMFYHRVELFFKLILKAPCHPIGKITDYFYRVEMQSRGTPHLHLLIWIENAPKFDVASDNDVCAFVNRYISAKLPDEENDPVLHEIVTSVQMHSRTHSKSCRKGKKKCRFSFPKPVSDETFIVRPCENTDTGTNQVRESERCVTNLFELLDKSEEVNHPNLELYAQCGFTNFEQFQQSLREIAKKPSIVLQRQQKDTWVNNYNPDLLRSWNANIDIQYVLDAYSCIMYIVSYISKSETELGEILKQARLELIRDGHNDNLRKQMQSLGSIYFDHREVSVQEAVIRLCSFKLKEFSRQVIFLATNEENTRMSIPLTQVKQKVELGSDDIWMTSQYDKYFARPKTPQFEVMCQAKFAADFRYLSKAEATKAQKSDNIYELQSGLGHIMKRTKSDSAIIRHTQFSILKEPEKHYLTLLKLYLPHRNTFQLKPDAFQSYQQFFEKGAVKLLPHMASELVQSIVAENRQCFDRSTNELQEAWAVLNAGTCELEDAWSLIAPNAELDRAEEMLERDEPTEDHDPNEQIPELQTRPGGNKEAAVGLCSYELLGENIRPLLRSMNTKQNAIFYNIRQWCINTKRAKSIDPFHIFLTGGAGVGKSHVIRCIYNEAHRLLLDSESRSDVTVLLLAPTGTAARSINGHTIHSALKIPINPQRLYQPLSSDSVNTLRATLSNLKILIIDEISMVSPLILQYVHGRLRQIKQIKSTDRTAWFGNVSILAVGDFFQLPPVRAQSLVIPSHEYGFDLFSDLFEKIELDEIMRQKDDATFAQLLNKLRVKSKHADLAAEDDALIRSRTDLGDEPDDALHVFATNNYVNEHNSCMLAKKCTDIVVAKAKDYQKDKTGRLRSIPTSKFATDQDLPSDLLLALQCRVMLTNNLDVADGLVNGVFGTVVGFEMEDNCVSIVYVQFDDKSIGRNNKCALPASVPLNAVAISRIESTLMKNKDIVRHQFPLKLGYAATIHKTQGMTVTQCVYDMRKTFAAGMAYVALSRVTGIQGLYIKNYDPQLIRMDEEVYQHLNCMKQLNVDRYLWKSKPLQELTIIHHNVQGLISKLEDVSSCYANLCHVMCFNETWLPISGRKELTHIEGYHMFKQSRIVGNHGGVAIYVTEGVKTELVEVNPTRGFEMCMVVTEINAKRYVVATMYRPSACSFEICIPAIASAIELAESVGNISSVIFTGDFNENLNTRAVHPIQNLFVSNGYRQIVNDPTYKSGSMLDAVYVKGKTQFEATLRPTYFSDHEALLISQTHSE